MAPDEKPRCKRQVYPREGHSFHRGHQCTRAAVTADGFCKVHSPEAEAARQQKSSETWKVSVIKRRHDGFSIGLGQILLAALKRIAEGDYNESVDAIAGAAIAAWEKEINS